MSATVGLDLGLARASAELVDISTRVDAARVDLVATTVDLVAIKVVLAIVEVDLVKA